MKLSIIMMAFNQCQYINEAIESVVSQDLPQNWELLIGDNYLKKRTYHYLFFKTNQMAF